MFCQTDCYLGALTVRGEYQASVPSLRCTDVPFCAVMHRCGMDGLLICRGCLIRDGPMKQSVSHVLLFQVLEVEVQQS